MHSWLICHGKGGSFETKTGILYNGEMFKEFDWV